MVTSDNSRTCIASLRSIRPHAGWCANYEFEDVVANIEDADLLNLRPGPAFASADWVIQRMLCRPGVRSVARHVNPNLVPITLKRDYDLFFFVCMHPFDLLYLNGIRGWRDRCKTKIVYLLEAYPGWTRKWDFHFKLLKDFDHVCVGLLGMVDPIQRLIDQPCHYVPFAVDTLRFTPLLTPTTRSIDVYSLGRRVESTHQVLLRLHQQNKIFYIYDTIPGQLLRPLDYLQHRDLVAGIAKRSRFFVAYPAKVDVPDEARGQSETGARYYEGAAAGTILFGSTPTVASFRQEFDWPDSTIDIPDEATLMYWLEEARRNPERMNAISRRNAIEALKRHDWLHRWKQILQIAGMEPTQKQHEREDRLNTLADRATREPGI